MPKPPDPWETASAQSSADMFKGAWDFTNKNIAEYTPYGSKTYEKSGTNSVYDPFTKQYIDVPTYSSHVNLAPGEQDILNKNTAMRGNIGDIGVQQSARLLDHLNKPINTGGLQAWNAGPGVQPLRQDQAPTDRKATEDALMERYNRYAKPQNEAQDVEMAARGMSPGSQGYSTMQQAQGDQFANATREAFLASGDESRKAQEAYNRVADQRFNQGGAAADRQNALHQNQWQERLSERNQPINEIMALLGGSQVNTPQFNAYNPASTSGVPIGQMIYDNYNARSEQAQNSLAGIAGIGSAVAGALPWASWLSDRRAKTDIMPIGAELAGVPLYTFRYWTDMGTTHIGVMADEAKAIHPDAVHMNGEDGFDYVDYAMLRRRH
jgi:hypothetical protein